MVSATDPNNNVTRYEPDERGRVKSVTDALGGTWDTTYDRSGLVRTSRDPLDRLSDSRYDAAGRLESVLDASGLSTRYSYDAVGRVAGSVSTGGGQQPLSTTLGYDPATSRLISETMGGRTWTNTYSPFGDLTSRVNPEGRQLRWSYDRLGRVASLTGVDGRRQDFGYDAADNLAEVTTPQVVADSFTAPDGSPIDVDKWVTNVVAGGEAGVSANAAELKVAESTGSRAEFVFNGSGRGATTVSFSVDLSNAPNRARLFAYNRFVDEQNFDLIEFRPRTGAAIVKRGAAGASEKLGTLKVPTDRAFNVKYVTAKNQVSVKIWALGEAEPAEWTLSVKTSLAFEKGVPKWTATGGRKASGSFKIDDISVERGSSASLASYTWDPDGRLEGEQLSPRASRSWDWQDGRLAGFSQQIGGKDVATQLGYDSAGRVASETTAGAVTNFGYDRAGQLLSVDAPGKKSDVTYTYDQLNRRETTTQRGVIRTDAYDAASQLVSSSPAGGTPTGYSYDGAGRRLSETTGDDQRLYTYDVAGRLTATTEAGVTTTRVLDPAGQPESIIGGDGTTLLDWTPGGELASLTRPGEGITTPIRAQGDSAWSVAMVGTGTKVLGSDIYGSTLNPNRLATANKYSEFGSPAGTNTTDASVSLGYRGELSISGLTYLRARNYDPLTGQFTTVDPVSGMPGTTSASNPYAYGNNDPLNQTDPSGLCSLPGFLAAANDFCGAVTDDPGGTFQAGLDAIGHRASKTWDWAVDHKAEIAGFVAGLACTAATGAVLACIALGGAARGSINGWETSCGGGASAGECAKGVIFSAAEAAAVDTAYGVAFMGLGFVGKGILKGGRQAVAAGVERWAARRAAASAAETGAVSLMERLGGSRVAQGAGSALERMRESWAARNALRGERGSIDFSEFRRSSKSTATSRGAAGDLVGPHGTMPRPRPGGMESHHGVNSVWAKANVPGYNPSRAPAVLMDSARHNATRGVFNRWRSEIAGRQGVPVRNIDWGAVSPGSIWRLAEEQFAAAGTAASTVDDYFVQWNRYIDNLSGAS